MKKLTLLFFILFSLKMIAQNPFHEKLQQYLPKKANIIVDDNRGIVTDSARIYGFSTLTDSIFYETRINTTDGNKRVSKFYTPARKLTYRDSTYTTPKVNAQYTYRESLSKPNDSLLLVNYNIDYFNVNKTRDSSKQANSFTSSSGFYELTINKYTYSYNTKNQLIKQLWFKGVYPNPLQDAGYTDYEYNNDGTLKKESAISFSSTSNFRNYSYPDAYTTIIENSGQYNSKTLLKYYDIKKLYLKEYTSSSPNAQGQMEVNSSVYLTYDKNNNLIKVESDYSKYNPYLIEETIWDACNQEKRNITYRGTTKASVKLAGKIFYYKDCSKVATNDNQILEGVAIFPNPVTNELFIQSEKEISKIEVRDITGRIVFNTNQNSNSINVNHLLSGVYIVSVYADNQYKALRFVKE